MNKTTTHRRWCVSNGSQALQRGQLGRLCLPDTVLLRHWDYRDSFATTGNGKKPNHGLKKIK